MSRMDRTRRFPQRPAATVESIIEQGWEDICVVSGLPIEIAMRDLII
jgi:hypothetical protein